jgi:serine/threonine-protein kinase
MLCARLAHPNIVAVLDAGHAPRDFIVMELVEGIEAGTLVQDLSSDEALHVLLQVADALSHAHDRGVLHEDVSLRNILVTPAWDATLIDFGLASSAAEARVAPRLSGTPGYVAPEVLRGAAPSPQSDLYSLGMVAYRLLAGPSVARAEAVPQAVQRAVAREPDLRQRSVAEFRAELVRQPGARRPGRRAAPPTRTSSARAA